ncbi:MULTISPECIES: ATP-binding protein [Pseudophaeobacter]|jgi:serine/threonine-protein kinase RsbW|uniref:ATP-binding protein n=1 Tax=Pseudophaeobacter TaxID=1541822 RepID=UPI00242E7E5A|nr:ATP-binding protein [Pseudophaeobacter profundi]
MAEIFACSFTATELDARSGISAVMERLREIDLPDERAGDVQIALAEAVNNVVEHAYAGTEKGDVRIKCNLYPQELRIQICDAGFPLTDCALPPGEPADLSGPIETLPEGGFGWFLIRELTSRLHYERLGRNNRLSLYFQVPPT